MSDANCFNNKNRRQNHDSSKTCKVDSLLHFLKMKTILSQVSTFFIHIMYGNSKLWKKKHQEA